MELGARVRKNPVYDAICFHAQQCAEKYLKARLYEADIRFAKEHNLLSLLGQALAVEPLWEVYREDLRFLTGFAVNLRYPGSSAGREKALDARARCRRFRQAARASLGLESPARPRRKRRTRRP